MPLFQDISSLWFRVGILTQWMRAPSRIQGAGSTSGADVPPIRSLVCWEHSVASRSAVHRNGKMTSSPHCRAMFHGGLVSGIAMYYGKYTALYIYNIYIYKYVSYRHPSFIFETPRAFFLALLMAFPGFQRLKQLADLTINQIHHAVTNKHQ